MARKKLEVSIFAGFLYWIITYLIVKYEHLFINIDLITPVIIYTVLPLLIGFIVLRLLNETSPIGILYCTVVICCNELVVLIDDAVFLPEEYDLLANMLARFAQVTNYSWLLAILGGSLAIYFNQKRQRQKK